MPPPGTFFSLKYATTQAVLPLCSDATNTIAKKTKAAAVFTRPAAEWHRLLTEHASKALPLQSVTCDCKCGCNLRSGPEGIMKCFICEKNAAVTAILYSKGYGPWS